MYLVCWSTEGYNDFVVCDTRHDANIAYEEVKSRTAVKCVWISEVLDHEEM